MKRAVLLCSLALLFALLFSFVLAEETEPETFTSGDYEYILLPDGTAEITKYSGEDEVLSIPDNIGGKKVTTIGQDAFYWCDGLTSVTIPDSVTSIGTNPFAPCRKLTDICVSLDHPVLAVIDGVLFYKPEKRLVCYLCAKAESSYTIPQGIQSIGDYAFFNCSNLTSITIPDSVMNIGNDAFSGCSSLTSVTIPESVTSIGANPFAYCDNLTEIRVSPDHPVLAVIDDVLFYKPEKRLVCYLNTKEDSSYTIPQGIQSIGDATFYFCTKLTSVTIPDSVTNIGSRSFFNCSRLTSVTIPDSVTNIGDLAFFFCTKLMNVTIPDNVTNIGNSAFLWCESLTSVTIPESVTYIGFDAFKGCDKLTLTVIRDSYAAQYCKENNLNYTYPDSLDWLNN